MANATALDLYGPAKVALEVHAPDDGLYSHVSFDVLPPVTIILLPMARATGPTRLEEPPMFVSCVHELPEGSNSQNSLVPPPESNCPPPIYPLLPRPAPAAL